MRKCITFFCNVFFLLTSTTALADTNSDLNDCLSASQGGGTNKIQCVTNVINEAQKKSKDQMIETYTNFVQESMGPGAVPSLITKPGAPLKVQPPPTSAVPQAQPTQQQPPPPSKPAGGIQYY
jgi:hypothetical protein